MIYVSKIVHVLLSASISVEKSCLDSLPILLLARHCKSLQDVSQSKPKYVYFITEKDVEAGDEVTLLHINQSHVWAQVLNKILAEIPAVTVVPFMEQMDLEKSTGFGFQNEIRGSVHAAKRHQGRIRTRVGHTDGRHLPFFCFLLIKTSFAIEGFSICSNWCDWSN